jgi:hypothetical protein
MVLVSALLLIGATALPAQAASPSIRISDAQVLEGASGYHYLALTVHLAHATGKPVTVGYRTVDGTATVGGGDYAPALGELTFHGRKVTKRVFVPVYGDRVHEATETLSVVLRRISGRATIKDGTGVGQIVNDDPGPQTLNVTVAGSGTVTSNPAGVSCPADCTETYPHGTAVALTAVPPTGWSFTGWSGGGCSGTGPCVVTTNQATSVTATFTIQEFTLNVTRAGDGQGVVTGPGISCPSLCTKTYPYNTVVTLTATPSSAAGTASTFTGWSGACTGTDPCTVSMTAARTVTASFTLSP